MEYTIGELVSAILITAVLIATLTFMATESTNYLVNKNDVNNDKIIKITEDSFWQRVPAENIIVTGVK